MLKITPLAPTPDAAVLLAAEHAPYLARLVERADRSAGLSHLSPDMDGDAVGAVLRKAKAATHLRLAASDLSGTLDVMQVTEQLTRFADDALDASLQAACRGLGVPSDGLFCVALGKMGAFELNYSSDIDIAAFYDPSIFTGGDRSPSDASARIMREVVRLMDQRTGDGYVFRTDLRLRPDPGSTPLCVSTEMAEVYYESVGQNWERMVWIKARHSAGDSAATARFLTQMEPFVWRRNLDYWAIGDIQAIKRMINRKVGPEALGGPAADVKLGVGGIREIEFFVQTQQLILGGRQPPLRDQTTLGAMQALVQAGVVEADTAQTLTKSYRALRNLEHRIQMRHDAQTHTLPTDEAERADVAALCGYSDLSQFDADVLETRRAVQAAYDGLFADEGDGASDAAFGNLVFTGVDDDPATVETLSDLGFSDPSRAIETIRNWHRGNVPATRTSRGRELLTAILPKLLETMAVAGDADEAFRWFTRFFEGLSSGVQTLSMLLAKPALLDDLVATLAIAPRLAEVLAKRPDLLEALVGGPTPDAPTLTKDTPFETAIDDWRRYHREQAFLIGHRLLHGQLAARDAAADWSALADTSIAQMLQAATNETIRRYGPQPGRMVVMAMGKLGGQEMTAGSDLDLLVIYEADDLEAAGWFTRLTQRLITALSAPTPEGILYEVDMRLRPSGRAGPVAVSLEAFQRYQTDDAWTWEHMALTRLRCVAGDKALAQQALRIGAGAIAARAGQGGDAIAADIADMRARLSSEKPGSGLWDVKLSQGGLIDIEFLIQREILLSGASELIAANTSDALKGVHRAGHFTGVEAALLARGLAMLQSLQQIQRIAIGADFAPETAPAALKERLCRAVGIAPFDALEAELKSIKTDIKQLSEKKLHILATETGGGGV